MKVGGRERQWTSDHLQLDRLAAVLWYRRLHLCLPSLPTPSNNPNSALTAVLAAYLLDLNICKTSPQVFYRSYCQCIVTGEGNVRRNIIAPPRILGCLCRMSALMGQECCSFYQYWEFICFGCLRNRIRFKCYYITISRVKYMLIILYNKLWVAQVILWCT